MSVRSEIKPNVRLLTGFVWALSILMMASVLCAVGSASASTGPNIEIEAVTNGEVPTDKGGPLYTLVDSPSQVSVKLKLTNPSSPPGGGSVTLTWRRSSTPCVRGSGGSNADLTGTNPSLAIASAANFGWYFVDEKITAGEVSTESSSNCIGILPTQSGPLNTPGPPPTTPYVGADGMNLTAFVALPDSVAAGTAFTTTITYNPGSGSKTVPVDAYALPTTGLNGITAQTNKSVTLWVGPLPVDVLGIATINVAWVGGPVGGRDVNITVAPQSGAGISVTQESVGSRSISVTATSPPFTGVVLPADSYATAFHVFDADTRAYIEPRRSGVEKSLVDVGGLSFLKSVDPLVLPESALGRRIRVGFVTYFFPKGYKDASSETEQFAALSDPITMRTSGGGGGGRGGAPEPEPSASPTVSPVTPAPVALTPAPAVAPPEIVNPSAVTVQEIESFSPEQVALIPPSEFRQLPPAAIGALSPQQVSALTPAQVNSLRPARAAAITPTAVAVMSPVQLEALRPAAVRALPAQTLAALDGPQLASLRPDAVARITPRALRALSPAQLRSLTSEQRERLTPRQLRALDPLQRAALT